MEKLEEGLAGGDDQSGVPQRILGQFLFWLRESESHAFVVAAADDVRSQPPKLQRKGRFDELFLVHQPGEEDRKGNSELHYRRCVKVEPDADQVQRLVDTCEGASTAGDRRVY
ncbi:hypothetical protein [Streptomyces sp. NPDC059513]